MQPAAGDDLPLINLDLDPNEASGLLTVGHPGLLEARGWDRGFWVVMDEGEVRDCVAVIGHRQGGPIDDGWEIRRLHARPVGFTGTTEDAEALARHDGQVWVFGSHFGKKAGPLQPRRCFVARFPEDQVGGLDGAETRVQVARAPFVLHRLVNNALADCGLPVVPLGPRSREAYITRTRARGAAQAKGWAGLLREDDHPLNVEGAAFRPDGTLLLGLRFPTTADGKPLLVDIEGIERLFAGGEPAVRGVWAVDAVGRGGQMAGFRDLTVVAGDHGTPRLHLVTGSIDAREKGSLLVQDYPEGAATVTTHWSCPLPEGGHGTTLTTTRVREFPALPRIEGIAADADGTFFYVSDEDEGVAVRHTPLLVADPDPTAR
jgi:hypothetical protein